MKKILLMAAALFAMVSCFDDSELWQSIKDHENRISELERLCTEMNTNIDALKSLVVALEKNDYITNVTPLESNGQVVGYTISFAKGDPITIYHGQDGKDGADGANGTDGAPGQDGKDGADGSPGQDGLTPVIGVRQDTDGVYYWTLNGEWLLDASGNKIPTTGKDGANGKDGIDGEDGKDGADGSDGAPGADGANGSDGQDGAPGQDGATGQDGKDGITPQLKIENGMWYVSYDNGASWVEVGQATGDQGPQGEAGAQGSQGNPGQNGDSFFQSVIQDEANVYFTLADGTVITIPKGAALSITFDADDLLVMPTESTRDINYTITSALSGVTVEVLSSSDIKAKIVPASEHHGAIRVTTGAVIDEYSKVVVLVSNAEKVIMKTLNFEEEAIEVLDEARVIVNGEGCQVELLYLSNVECKVSIPEEAQSWISVVPATRAMEKHKIILNLKPNEGAARSAEVVVKSPTGNLSITYIIEQEAGLDYQLALEREALIAIYNALGGDNWTNNENWCSDKPVGEWYGVYANYDGTVESLRLDGQNLVGELPDDVYNLTNLRDLSIWSNFDLTIRISPQIGSLTKLETLTLGACASMPGKIPEEIGLLTNLRRLHIDALGDLQDGPIPNSIGNCKKMCSLAIQNASCGGGIPEGIYKLQNLTSLDLHNASLTGKLSEDIGNLINLQSLNLMNNDLYGEIPESLGNLKQLTSVRLINNHFSGLIPDSVKEFKWWDYGWMHITSGNNFDIERLEIKGPEFTVYDINNEEIDAVSTYKKNKLTILYQWGTDFYGVYEPTLKDLYEKYHSEGLEIIGWFQGDSYYTACIAKIKEDKLKWPNFYFTEGNDIPGLTELGWGWVYNGSYYCYAQPSFPGGCVVNTDGIVIYDDIYLYTSPDKLDAFVSSYFDEEYYRSSDYSQDGIVTTLQKATKGNGIDVILMGDAYSDRQIADGTYAADMEYIYNNLFTEEPYKSFKDYFDVHCVNAVSATEGYEYGHTALSGYFGDGTLVGGNNNVCFAYALKAISEEEMDEALIIVAMNSDNYAGTCYMYYPESVIGTYGSGPSVAYFPKGGDQEAFAQLLHHEACGHGFAKLADEYSYEYMGAVPGDYAAQIAQQQNEWGWWKNVDFTSDPAQVRWSYFLSDERYQYDGLGCFEGGLTYWSGVWRPTEDSIMRYNTGGFNAPSREAIYYRIHKLAFGDSWEYDYEDFVKYDAINRASSSEDGATARRKRANYVERTFEPTAPPVIMKKSWRDAK